MRHNTRHAISGPWAALPYMLAVFGLTGWGTFVLTGSFAYSVIWASCASSLTLVAVQSAKALVAEWRWRRAEKRGRALGKDWV